ncbi:Ig-like domain-containing protein [Treponema denticola]|uniref:Ig-like domain-containing protein n=1 Tax=Treponema denticola TaxID=158 RepID=UPI0020A28EF7|nr:Ig-like domain-containing protein [Treponema denticola]UTD12418.1 Ig-like domain-containing protein [Treponema denticola]
MKTSKSIKRILMGAALFMLFTGLFTGCPQKIKDKKISVDGISLDKNELDLGIGESSKLSAAISPANASNKKITWTSDKPEIAEVDQNGNVTGKADGNAVITATTEDGGKTATCTVKVKFIHIDTISLDKNELDLGIGESSKLSITITPANASNKKITWTSDKPEIAEVDQNGNVTCKAVGNAVITVTTEDGNKTANCNVTVKFIHIESISLDKNELELGIGESYALSAAISPANASNKKITWTSDNSGIAEVDQNGNVTGKADGNAVITVTTEDGNKTATCTVKVEKGAILILSPDKKDIKIIAITSSGNITVIGCTQTELTGNSMTATTLNATSDRVILKGDIIHLSCYNNKLTNLYVQGLNDLKELYCYENQLTSLNVQGLNNLEELSCSENQLTSLNLHGLNNLKKLNCSGNQLTSLNVQGLNNLESLNCDRNQLTSLNVQGLNNLKSLNCSGNQLTSLDVQGLNNLELLYCYENQLTSLDVQGLNNLKSLCCFGNQLTNLDVQGLNNLKNLECYGNQLTSLDVDGLNNLKSLNCYVNQLTSLNVQGLNNLESLNCFGNQLTSLNVQSLNNLKSLYCSGNQLTSLDVQGLNNLESLNCDRNQLTKEVFRKLFDDLPARTAEHKGICFLYAEITGITEGNYTGFTMEELKAIKDKNWNTYKVNSSGDWEEI